MKTSKQQKKIKLEVKNNINKIIKEKKNLKISIPKNVRVKFDNYTGGDTPKIKHKEIEIIL